VVQNKINVVFSKSWDTRKCGIIRNNEKNENFSQFMAVENLYSCTTINAYFIILNSVVTTFSQQWTRMQWHYIELYRMQNALYRMQN